MTTQIEAALAEIEFQYKHEKDLSDCIDKFIPPDPNIPKLVAALRVAMGPDGCYLGDTILQAIAQILSKP